MAGAQFYIPASHEPKFSFLHTLANTCYFLLYLFFKIAIPLDAKCFLYFCKLSSLDFHIKGRLPSSENLFFFLYALEQFLLYSAYLRWLIRGAIWARYHFLRACTLRAFSVSSLVINISSFSESSRTFWAIFIFLENCVISRIQGFLCIDQCPMWCLSFLILSLFSLLISCPMCVVFFFFSSKNKLLDPFRVPLLLTWGVYCPGKPTLGVLPSGVPVGQLVVMMEGLSSGARWSEFKCSFFYLLTIWPWIDI